MGGVVYLNFGPTTLVLLHFAVNDAGYSANCGTAACPITCNYFVAQQLWVSNCYESFSAETRYYIEEYNQQLSSSMRAEFIPVVISNFMLGPTVGFCIHA